MSEKEWHPSYPDWSKETRCIQCRFPKRQFGFFNDELNWITCRTCKHIEINTINTVKFFKCLNIHCRSVLIICARFLKYELK